MLSTFDKLNLKNQRRVLVLQAPESFEAELVSLRGVTVHRNPAALGEIEFALAFVTTQKAVDAVAKTISKKAKGDAVIWFAYPKGTSKKYKSEITRNGSWQVLGALGFEPVRMIAIDQDWSAIRFRRVEFIKTMTRAKEHRLTERASSAITTAGKGSLRAARTSRDRSGPVDALRSEPIVRRQGP